jgi:hypothetical protein
VGEGGEGFLCRQVPRFACNLGPGGGGPLPYKSGLGILSKSNLFTRASGNEVEPRSPLSIHGNRFNTALAHSTQLMSPYLDDSAAAAQAALETPLKAAPQLVAPEPGIHTSLPLKVYSLS